MKKDIYRKAALERLATVDQLDRAMKITSPLSWLALLGVTLIIAAVIAWSILGTLPATITANGIIVSASSATNTILAEDSGSIEILVREGEEIWPGKKLATISKNNAEQIDCVADQRGFIKKILVDRGAYVSSGTELFSLRPNVGAAQVAVCYVPVSDIGKIKMEEGKDTSVHITLTSADSNTSGYMQARVINVDRTATSTRGIGEVVGSENNMVNQYTQNGPVCAVTCQFALDPSSKSGYWWSNEHGKEQDIENRMMCSGKIITAEERPITRLFAKLKDIWGGK